MRLNFKWTGARKVAVSFIGFVGAIIAYGVLIGNGYVSGYLGNTVTVTNVLSVAHADAREVTARELIDSEKKQIVRDLSDKCEFKNKKHAPYHIDNKDSGGQQVVFGDYQFYPPTIVEYMKSLRKETIDLDGAVMLALDEVKAFALAYDIIWIADGIHNWGNCARDLGLHDRIANVKAQEKKLKELEH